MTFSTVPLSSADGLDRSIVDVLHGGHVIVRGSLPLADAARTMAARQRSSAGGPVLGVVAESDLLVLLTDHLPA